jgi:ribosome maturation factor RimP
MRKPDLEKIEGVVEPVASSIGCELVSCEWSFGGGKGILRVFIDRPEGAKLSDCEKLSRLLDPVLEVEDLISSRYTLEVSTPGLERPLKKLTDFTRFAGQKIRLRTKIPIEHRSHFKGTLKGVEGEEVLMEVEGLNYRIPHKEVDRANLEVDWKLELKKKRESGARSQ